MALAGTAHLAARRRPWGLRVLARLLAIRRPPPRPTRLAAASREAWSAPLFCAGSRDGHVAGKRERLGGLLVLVAIHLAFNAGSSAADGWARRCRPTRRSRSGCWPWLARGPRSAHPVVHELGETTAHATEGTPTGIGINWERCRYDWSEPGRVTATVTGSNVYARPGSFWQLTATPSEHGSRVEMVWQRTFRRNPIFGSYARQVIANLEQLERNPISSALND